MGAPDGSVGETLPGYHALQARGPHLDPLLAGAMAHPEPPVSALPVVTSADTRQLAEWNATAADYPRQSTLVHLFDAQVTRTPEAVAVSVEGAALTYAQLNARANKLAHYLIARGVAPDVLVGLSVPRSLEMVVGLLGILKAGGAYIPLDPTYPPERLAFMLEDAGPPLIVTIQPVRETLPPHAAMDVCLDTDGRTISQEAEHAPTNGATPDGVVYALYTSGSTGKPKGVLGVHRAAVNRCAWMWSTWPFTPGEVCCQKTSLNFVDSVWEIFGPLLSGIQTVILPDAVVKDPHRFVDCLAANHVSRLVLVPSLLRVLLDSHADLGDRLPGLRHWICSGEALPLDLCRRFHRVLPGAVLLNLYGSSEVAADVSWFDTRLLTPEMDSVPIGRAIANTQLYVLDESGQRVPIGMSGELYVGGDGLARSYLQRPALTRERFVPDPFGTDPGQRLYRTGDQARWRADGTLEYLGRRDQQVKLRGMRIELGEIEAALVRQPGVREAVVAGRTEGDEVRLVAYVVSDDPPGMPPPPQLRRHLTAILPDYMVPSAFVRLDRLPLTPTGKVDRLALPAPAQDQTPGVHAHPGPPGPIEEKLAHIWSELLGADRVGVDDNFFDLGGHSFLAVRLFSRIEQTFTKRLPLATLLEAPTIAQLAQRVGAEDARPSWSSLVPIQSEGSRVPIFCIHGAGANVLHLRTLSQHLGTDQPFYGLQSPGLDGATAPYERIEEMAAHYLRDIRPVQPTGPYIVGGFSLGGIIAFEMAQQLEAEGQPVGLLFLIDTHFPGTPSYGPAWTRSQRRVYTMLGILEFHLGTWARLGSRRFVRHWWVWARDGVKRRIARVAQRLRWPVAFEGWDAPESLKHVVAANLRAERTYTPRMYPGAVVLFRGSEPVVRHTDTRLTWDEVAGDGLEVHGVPGDHNSLREEPHVRVLAAKLTACLNRRMLYSTHSRSPH